LVALVALGVRPRVQPFCQGYDSEKRFYAGMAQVTREDVIRVANEIFGRPSLRIFVRPEGGADRGNE
jgi:hypothetical protein